MITNTFLPVSFESSYVGQLLLLRVDDPKRKRELGGLGIAPCWLFEGLSLGLRADLRILWNKVVSGSGEVLDCTIQSCQWGVL